MYLANTTRPDIAFVVNLLARYSSVPTRRHWNGIKHILRYLKGTTDMGIFYSINCSPNLVGYADAGYLSDPHKARSQTGYVFICGGSAISWRSTKQSIVATSSNHAQIIAIHKASTECVWLRSMIRSNDNVTNLFTKSLPTATFKKMVHKLGMQIFKSLD
ncbi:secreted RxLR effector protein 161-like [Solanum lycopersicum]|uniref:secreted RxLR effector protein 161-like n=1 Tax=Solanum lycopersicum TaxID=4081 RepID=UPI003749BD5A